MRIAPHLGVVFGELALTVDGELGAHMRHRGIEPALHQALFAALFAQQHYMRRHRRLKQAAVRR